MDTATQACVARDLFSLKMRHSLDWKPARKPCEIQVVLCPGHQHAVNCFTFDHSEIYNCVEIHFCNNSSSEGTW